MPKIHSLKITNFQGIESFDQQFDSNFVCIIGRGDSGKTTILNAISYVLHPSWNLLFHDTDFFNCNINNNIEIEATLYEVPEKLLQESKYGLNVRCINPETGIIQDEIVDDFLPCLTIKLIVDKTLEPKWFVVNSRMTDVGIRHGDRSLFNVFLISDYIERHFSWNRGTPLYSLFRNEGGELESSEVILNSIREAKDKIDLEVFSKFDNVLDKVKTSAGNLGLDISEVSTTIDFRDISIREGKVSLHDETIPFRQKGKGTKRLLSIAIQNELVKAGGIILIDEIEQGLEPDRVQHLVSTLRRDNNGQIFITTHSSNVLVELDCKNLFLKKHSESKLHIFDSSLQGCLRNSPEVFFSKKVIVCEGATELGICRELNSYRIGIGEKNMAFLGVKIMDGTGSNIVEYCRKFKRIGYDVCLFCDSDVANINDKKVELIGEGVKIIDWDEPCKLEEAIFMNIPFGVAQKLIDLAIFIKKEDSGETIDTVKTDVYTSLSSSLGRTFPETLTEENYTDNIKQLLGKISGGKSAWFKQIGKGIRLGKEIFDNYSLLEEDNKIKIAFGEISNWIDND